VALLAFAAERRAAAPLLLTAGRAAIGRYFLQPGAQQQTRSNGVQRASDGTDRQTDRQTDARPLHRPCCAQDVGDLTLESFFSGKLKAHFVRARQRRRLGA